MPRGVARRAINGWPEGVRRVRCLRCDETFPSRGKNERLCPPCRDFVRDARVDDDGYCVCGVTSVRDSNHEESGDDADNSTDDQE